MNTLLKPNINSITITPNPINANTGFSIAISVSEIEVVLEPTILYCGTFSCGDEAGI
ncbi:hypothetical protein KPL28_03400 [Clostridium algidicarnis]|uniref:hypothetical protein n=1 Tax=Clostridium algidicarnis TaxID=37659 RepID=UPI001C0AEC7D|nr:hypothetical protein [Clostridium algidicarnis]MBU3208682.1 hypothetical protein [Clostridium algidicarnis]